MEPEAPKDSMPAGLMRRPTPKSQTDAAVAQKAESDRERLTTRDVIVAWDAPGTPGIESARFSHPYGVVSQYSDPYTGAVVGHELRTPDGRSFPYNAETDQIQVEDDLSLYGGRSLENEGGTFLQPKRDGTTTSMLRLSNGSTMEYDAASGEVTDSRERSVLPNGSTIESTLYVDTSTGRPVVSEHRVTVNPSKGNVIERYTNLETGEKAVTVNGSPINPADEIYYNNIDDVGTAVLR